MTPQEYLKQLGQKGDGPHDIAYAALMLGALDHPQKPLERSLMHIVELADAMRAEAPMILRVGDGARALVNLFARHGYEGDRVSYNDPANANLISVIERRRGLPVALGILAIHAARAAGMKAEGLNTQGHFVIRVTHRHDDLTLDPFNSCNIVDRDHMPAELRGANAGLAQPVSDTDVLLRLDNNLKLRALENGENERALDITTRMTLIAPRRPDLWFDMGRINEALGVLGAARGAYEKCLEFARQGEPLHNEATVSLSHLKRRLN